MLCCEVCPFKVSKVICEIRNVQMMKMLPQLVAVLPYRQLAVKCKCYLPGTTSIQCFSPQLRDRRVLHSKFWAVGNIGRKMARQAQHDYPCWLQINGLARICLGLWCGMNEVYVVCEPCATNWLLNLFILCVGMFTQSVDMCQPLVIELLWPNWLWNHKC